MVLAEFGAHHVTLTPAKLGNSVVTSVVVCRSSANPRACGKRLPQPYSKQHAIRSPPPAHAGNTCVGSALRGWLSVHPRARGKYITSILLFVIGARSPPRTRGIPAYLCPGPSYLPFTPRTRETRELALVEPRHVPLTPRTRGIRCFIGASRPGLPFTPAHAGNTSRVTSCLRLAAVHPRARGKYSAPANRALCLRRSPPRTREIRVRVAHGDLVGPFTPAHAGNTSADSYDVRQNPVHPRARGKHPNLM